MWRLLLIVFLIGFFQVPNSVYAESPREAAERVAREAITRARAEKERNDAIVEKQRAAERAAERARKDRERTRQIEGAECKTRTC